MTTPAIREEMWNVMKFWLELGVDGFRLDAVPYLVEREGTNCENLPETHAVIKNCGENLTKHFPGKMLLAEAINGPRNFGPTSPTAMNSTWPSTSLLCRECSMGSEARRSAKPITGNPASKPPKSLSLASGA